jgi:hypothetical protein
MTSYFSALVDLVHVHSQYTHVAIFLLALSEAIPVIGTVVPGSTLIVGLSVMSALPPKRTCAVHWLMSALGQKRTFAGHHYSSFVVRFCQREFALTRWARYTIAAIESGFPPTIKASSSFTRYRKGLFAGSFTRLHFAFDMATNYLEGFAE